MESQVANERRVGQLLRFFKTIWTAKATTPAKVVARFAFTLLFFAHVLTVYPARIKHLLLGTEGRIRTAAERVQTGPLFYVLAGLILGAGFLARLWRLTPFLTVGESKWLVFKIPTFFNELIALNWHKLLISDKPGITLAWLTELGLLFTDKEGNGLYLADPNLLFFSRLPLIVANIL